ncbi:MAG: riboflavin biosynthesis protein RibF [Oscillospiraceae bacterium]|nr:riboflavin biosynthesis protein RibF [Oscillospiraceae bacterium]
MGIDNEKKTAVALGMFDGVHLGHAKVIGAVLGSERSAVFTFAALHEHSLIQPCMNKFARLRELGIQFVYSSDFNSVKDLSAEEFVRDILVGKMNAERVACGCDFRFAKSASADADELRRLCERYGVEVSVVQPVTVGGEAISSTRIRAAIRSGDIAAANTLLGYDLRYTLEVVEGAKLGRTLDFPTINQTLPETCVLPRFGVYKSSVQIGGAQYRAITNIGNKPTVSDGKRVTMETHIPGFSFDLYGQAATVILHEFVREERKFASIDELKKQIDLDIRKVFKTPR